MNENINLVEILKDCPKGTKLYTPLCGEVIFCCIEENGNSPIRVKLQGDLTAIFWFTKDGRHYNYPDGECLLFPSKDQRDWNKFKPKKSKFDPKTLQPFDKVLVRDNNDREWIALWFSHIRNVDTEFKYLCMGFSFRYCIPCNEETKHLVGTSDEAPEYYRYWED